jgi:hypothetical protein
MTRLVLTGPAANLIDAKLDLVYRHMVQLPGGSPFMSTHSLKLVRSEVGECQNFVSQSRRLSDTSVSQVGRCRTLRQSDGIASNPGREYAALSRWNAVKSPGVAST